MVVVPTGRVPVGGGTAGARPPADWWRFGGKALRRRRVTPSAAEVVKLLCMAPLKRPCVPIALNSSSIRARFAATGAEGIAGALFGRPADTVQAATPAISMPTANASAVRRRSGT